MMWMAHFVMTIDHCVHQFFCQSMYLTCTNFLNIPENFDWTVYDGWLSYEVLLYLKGEIQNMVYIFSHSENSKIVNLFKPFLAHTCCPLIFQVTCFNNTVIDSTVLKALESNGVHIYSDHVLAQWNNGAEEVTEISSASFTTNKQPTQIECGVSNKTKIIDWDFLTFITISVIAKKDNKEGDLIWTKFRFCSTLVYCWVFSNLVRDQFLFN